MTSSPESNEQNSKESTRERRFSTFNFPLRREGGLDQQRRVFSSRANQRAVGVASYYLSQQP